MPTTIIGILLAIMTAFGVMFMGGMAPVSIFFGDPGSVLLVFGGSILATFASGSLSDMTTGLKAGIKTMISSPKTDLAPVIAQITAMADKARKEGVLALDKEIEGIEDPFLARGIQLVVCLLYTSDAADE